MLSLQTRIDRWLLDEYRTDPESLGLFRILFGSYVLVAVLPLSLWIRDVPGAAFSPPVGFAALFQAYPPHWILVLLNAVALFSACALVIGWHTVAASFGTALGIVTLESFAFADGKIDHTILLVLTPLVLARSGWGATFSVDERRARSDEARPSVHQPWLLALLAMLIGFALLTGGLGKIHGGWLRSSSLATKWHVLSNYRFDGRETTVAFWALCNLPKWAWKWMDWATVLWEAGFILTVPKRTACRVACAFGACFHFGVWLLFDITFGANVLTYGAFVSWACLWPSATVAFRKRLGGLSPVGGILVCAIPFAVAAGSLLVLGADPSTALSLQVDHYVLSFGVIVAAAYLTRLPRVLAARAQTA